jgi:hypothetical protein
MVYTAIQSDMKSQIFRRDLQVSIFGVENSSTLKMDTAGSSEMLVPPYHSTQHHIPEHSNLLVALLMGDEVRSPLRTADARYIGASRGSTRISLTAQCSGWVRAYSTA